MTTRTPPTEPGWYWFRGKADNPFEDEIELQPVEVFLSKKGKLYISINGEVFWPEELIGEWQAIPAPVWTEE